MSAGWKPLDTQDILTLDLLEEDKLDDH